MKSEGTVILWNKRYGFVEIDEKESVYFYRNCLNTHDSRKIALLDIVYIEYDINRIKGKHFGKLKAHKVSLVKKGSFADYRRIVGRLKKWNGTYGFIDSKQLNEDIFTFYTRLIHIKRRLQEGDFAIFYPVKSTTNVNNYSYYSSIRLNRNKI